MKYSGFTLGVPHMRDAIVMGPELERRGELHDDVYYPLLNAEVMEDYMDYDGIQTLPKSVVNVQMEVGSPMIQKELYIEDHFAYLVEE